MCTFSSFVVIDHFSPLSRESIFFFCRNYWLSISLRLFIMSNLEINRNVLPIWIFCDWFLNTENVAHGRMVYSIFQETQKNNINKENCDAVSMNRGRLFEQYRKGEEKEKRRARLFRSASAPRYLSSRKWHTQKTYFFLLLNVYITLLHNGISTRMNNANPEDTKSKQYFLPLGFWRSVLACSLQVCIPDE